MDKLVLPIPSNGFPFNNDDIRFFLGLTPYSRGIYQALEGIISAYDSNIIVSGCEVSGSDIAEGWVLIAGTLVKVDAHTATDDYFEISTTYNSAGNKQTQTGGAENSYQQNRATATASSGTLESPVTGSPATLGKGFTLNLVRNDSDFEASEINKGVAELANQTEGRGGTDATRIMTSLRMLDALRNGSAFAASTTNRGTVEKATVVERDAATPDRYIDAELLGGVTGGLITLPPIDIGTWNMYTLVGGSRLTTIADPWVISNFDKIRSISAIIRNDANTNRSDFATGAGSDDTVRLEANNTGVVLRIAGDSVFDDIDHNSTGYNRGWVTIKYLP